MSSKMFYYYYSMMGCAVNSNNYEISLKKKKTIISYWKTSIQSYFINGDYDR